MLAATWVAQMAYSTVGQWVVLTVCLSVVQKAASLAFLSVAQMAYSRVDL